MVPGAAGDPYFNATLRMREGGHASVVDFLIFVSLSVGSIALLHVVALRLGLINAVDRRQHGARSTSRPR
jgi:hypothetical protein